MLDSISPTVVSDVEVSAHFGDRIAETLSRPNHPFHSGIAAFHFGYNKSVNDYFTKLIVSVKRYSTAKLLYFGQWQSTVHKRWHLTHWGRATHICVRKLTIIASDNGLSPGRRQAIIWNNAGILSNGLLGTNLSEILIKILTFISWKCAWKCRLRNGGHFASASMC